MDMGEYAIAFCTDGVGSKVLVAQELEIYDTVGIDCVAMNVNDAICVGAEPVSMVDYLALQKTDEDMIKNIGKGLYDGAKKANISIVGGETASLPDMIVGVNGKGFDLAASVIGVVKKDKIITGKNIEVGDVVLGFKSSGLHSNGYTLARKVLPKTMWIGILNPSRIYVKEVLELISKYNIHGLANITGGGFMNLRRLTNYGFVLDSMPEPQMIFKKIQELGKISTEEMYKTFNMGIGFCVIASEKDTANIIDEYSKTFEIMRIGKVVEEPQVVIINKGIETRLNRILY